MTDFYTENFAEMGARERDLLMEILKQWDANGLPNNFGDENVRPAFNKNSGNVFLVNDDYQVAMSTDSGSLQQFYNTPYEGHEGFIEDLLELYPEDLNEDDIDYIYSIAKEDKAVLPEIWVEWEKENRA